MKKPSAEWVWRIPILAAIVWVGFEGGDVRHELPESQSYQSEESLRRIEQNTRRIDDQMEAVERNTRKH